MYKAKEIAKWFLIRDRGEDYGLEISNLKLQKLLYYAQGVCLAISNEPLFEESLIAWEHGPVVKDVYDEYKDNKSNLIEYKPVETDSEIIQSIENNEDVRDILEFVIKEYGQYTAWKLRNMTHDERPWNETNRNQIISNQLIKQYFLDEVVEVG